MNGTMRFCPSCGASWEGPGARFCPSCGAPAPGGGSPRGTGWRRAVLAATLALVVLAAAATAYVAFDDDPEQGEALPSPRDLPEGTVAFVAAVDPALASVTRTDLSRTLEQRAASDGLDRVPAPGDEDYAEQREAALGELLDAIWLEGQADEMGIEVGRGEVAAELAKVKRENFEGAAEYREFLDESHFSQADVDARVRLQVLSEKIERRIRGDRGERAAQRAFSRFVRLYQRRWRARTVCAPGVAFDRCSNGPRPAGGDGSAGEPSA